MNSKARLLFWPAVLLVSFVGVYLFLARPKADPWLWDMGKAGPEPRDVELDPARTSDRFGNPLPFGAVARLGRADAPGLGLAIPDLAFSPDGSLLAFIAQDADTLIWDVKAEAEIHRLPHHPIHWPTGIDRRVFTADGRLLVGDGGAAWDAATGQPVNRFGPALGPGGYPLHYPTPSPNGKAVAFLTNPVYEVGEVVVFEVATRKEVLRFGKGDRVDGPMVFAPDGRTLATAKAAPIVVTPNADPAPGRQLARPADDARGLLLWDAASGEKRAEWLTKGTEPRPVGFTLDGKTLYTREDGRLSAWDVAAGKPIGGTFGPWVDAAVLLPDGKTLAVAERHALSLWSAADRKEIGCAPLDGVKGVTSSPTGRWVASGSGDGTVLIWDVAALRAAKR